MYLEASHRGVGVVLSLQPDFVYLRRAGLETQKGRDSDTLTLQGPRQQTESPVPAPGSGLGEQVGRLGTRAVFSNSDLRFPVSPGACG